MNQLSRVIKYVIVLVQFVFFNSILDAQKIVFIEYGTDLYPENTVYFNQLFLNALKNEGLDVVGVKTPTIDLFWGAGQIHHDMDSKYSKEMYLIENPELAKSKMDPWMDYFLHGKKENRKWPVDVQQSQIDYLQLFNYDYAILHWDINNLDGGDGLFSIADENSLLPNKNSKNQFVIVNSLTKKYTYLDLDIFTSNCKLTLESCSNISKFAKSVKKFAKLANN